ncbi:MAG: GatB/YqeY domain-containing protein [Propionibacteriaceae bacterium]|jgi:uncharacterized protein YqeY|nr:GatB/YqeY domain-containing protein [Propionibacteriaceae bacterium]
MTGQPYFAKTEPFAPVGGASEAVVIGEGVLKLRLKDDLKTALKARDEAAKSTLRMALAALQNAEVAGAQVKALTEAEELAVLTKEVRKREDAAETYRNANRPELADKEAEEAVFLSRYLPQPLTETELIALVDAAVAETTAELGAPPTMKNMGAIVKAVNAAASGRADGGKIAALVKARLG